MIKTRKLILFILALAAGTLGYEQHDYILTTEKIEVTEENPKYVRMLKSVTYKYNRTQAVLNATLEFKTSFEDNLEMHFQGYKLSSNEYRLFPIVMKINVCETLSRNDFGIRNVYDCGSFPRCPMKKGLYSICNWIPDARKFPPFHPVGRYMAYLSFSYRDENAFKALFYYKVEKIMKYAYFYN